MASFANWVRRIHFYVGLYMLSFVLLFAFTGLLLNHPKWRFAEFWQNRQQSSESREIHLPVEGSDLEQAREIMRQLNIEGEIEWTKSRADASRLEFRVARPGHIREINADLERNTAVIQKIDLNGWGKARILHTFTGVKLADPVNRRDWFLTALWAWSMDAVAAGLILMVLTSYYLWWALRSKRPLGMAALALGTLTCGIFVAGLRWLSS